MENYDGVVKERGGRLVARALPLPNFGGGRLDPVGILPP